MPLLNQYSQSGRLKVTLVDLSKTEDVIAKLPGADLLWLESPSNPCLDVADLPALISAAKSQKILVMVDNTFAPHGRIENAAVIAAIPDENIKVLPPSRIEIDSSSALQDSFPYRP